MQFPTLHTRAAIKVVAKESEARLLVDPMRREILRLISREALTEKDLSSELGLTAPSIGYHLKSLSDGNLISMVRSKPESHGIVQKWYLADAQAFIVDKEHLPSEIKRYFMPMDIERARGVIASRALFDGEAGPPSTESMERLAQMLCKSIVKTAHGYETRQSDEDPELIIHGLYKEAIKQISDT